MPWDGGKLTLILGPSLFDFHFPYCYWWTMLVQIFGFIMSWRNMLTLRLEVFTLFGFASCVLLLLWVEVLHTSNSYLFRFVGDRGFHSQVVGVY